MGSAYDTQLPESSIDVIFCMSLIHHLDLPRVKGEMLRVLRPGGLLVLKEPVRFSRTYDRLRSILPGQGDVSEDEYPLTEAEFFGFQEGFESDGLRFFRLPFVPLVQRTVPTASHAAFRLSKSLLTSFAALSRFATVAVVRLHKRAGR